MMAGKDTSGWVFPEDAEYHFEELKNRTARFRQAPVHEYANYEGPWIENIFIKEFMDRPLSYFNGFIPIFIQWIDTQILRGRHFDNIYNELSGILRPNVIYLAISQGDVGLGKIGTANPNIFVLAAGGYGHVPIPLVRAEIPYEPLPQQFEQDIGFFGNSKQASRPQMLAQLHTLSTERNLTFRHGQGPTWQKDMSNTKFNLAPRGYGRSSFRFAEAIQMGRVPIFLYDDLPWIPYVGTNLSVENFGFSAGLSDEKKSLVMLADSIKNLTEVEFAHKVQLVLDARFHFTYPGVVRQIEMFIADPFGERGGNLRCTTHPKTERCCGRS